MESRRLVTSADYDAEATMDAPATYRPTGTLTEFARRRRRSLCILLSLLAVAVFLIAVLVPTVGHKHPDTPPSPGPNSGFFSTAAVASDVAQCSAMGSQVLEEGGSAVDAAIVTLLCNGVINAHSSGIGGGGFMIIRNASQVVEVINMREQAPSGATVNMYSGNETLAAVGGLSVAIPGEIRGMQMAHLRHGHLSWESLFTRVADMAESGFAVTSALAKAVAVSEKYIFADPGLRATYAPGGKLVVAGQVITRTNLAGTLRTIGTQGADAFYTGPIAQAMVDDINLYGGNMTMADFASYYAELEEPVSTIFGDLTLYSVPPPASGPVLISMLNIMSTYLSPSYETEEERQLSAQHLVEAMKWAFAQRTQLGDPKYVNVTEIVDEMLSMSHAEWIKTKIFDNQTFPYTYYGPVYDVEETPGTTHISILTEANGANGDAVSVTSTVNTYFGSKILSPSTGVVLNDEMDDFSAPNVTNSFGVLPSPANFIAPGKRPLSSTVPSIAVDAFNKTRVVVGASGGTKITTATAQVLLDIVSRGMSVSTSIARARLHDQLLPQYCFYEDGFDPAIVNFLLQIGHAMVQWTDHAVVQGITLLPSGVLEAASDPRKGGVPSGY